MTDETRQNLEYCVKKLAEMRRSLDQIKADLDRLRPSRLESELASFEAWYEKHVGPLEREDPPATS